MKKFIIAVTCLLFALPVLANQPPPEPEGIEWRYRSQCSDNEYPSEHGTCVIGVTPDGSIYLVFWQQQRLSFVRRVKPEGGYETIWVADHYSTF